MILSGTVLKTRDENDEQLHMAPWTQFVFFVFDVSKVLSCWWYIVRGG